jgi:protein phosphatase
VSLGRHAAATHAGRKRRHNEDAYVVEPPLFVLADGMGGAQAGEVASGLATDAARELEDSGGGPEARVTNLIQEANRRIHKRAESDPATAGMGTTMTVAVVEDGVVTIGHVGDSRAYLFRDGELSQVTEDHSLVQELVRSGRLSQEDAETHPQRSVITRALGTDPDVDVDTFTVEAQPGDLFILCSDGLTDMVGDDEIQAVVEKNRADLERTAKALVRAANRGGGDDNITVVCFEIVEAGAELPTAPTSPEPVEEAVDTDDEDTLSGLAAPEPVRTVQPVPWASEEWEPGAPRPRAKRRRRRRLAFAALGTLILLAVAAALGLWGLSRSHFVGAEKDGHLAVYQGIPYDLFGGARLYRSTYVSEKVDASQLTVKERRKLFDHDLLSEARALAKIRQFEQELEP